MKTMKNTRLIAIALVAFFAVSFASPAMANDDKRAIPVELKFIGDIKNQLHFQMSFTGIEENEFSISIRDEFNNVLYSENVTGGNFTKKFLINIEELGDAELKFVVTGKKFKKPVVFETNRQSHFVEDVVVSRIK